MLGAASIAEADEKTILMEEFKHHKFVGASSICYQNQQLAFQRLPALHEYGGKLM